jgi:hypothetical protein
MISLYCGDSWSYSGTAKLVDVAGQPTDLDGWSLESSLFDKNGKIILQFDINWLDISTGEFYHRLIDSSKVKPGWYKMAVTFVSPVGERITTDPVDVTFLSIGKS